MNRFRISLPQNTCQYKGKKMTHIHFNILLLFLLGGNLAAETDLLEHHIDTHAGLRMTFVIERVVMTPLERQGDGSKANEMHDVFLVFENISEDTVTVPLNTTILVIEEKDGVAITVSVLDELIDVPGTGYVTPKPSRADLKLVDLDEGEFAMIEVGRFPFDKCASCTVTVRYYVSDELGDFYDLWTGSLAARVDI